MKSVASAPLSFTESVAREHITFANATVADLAQRAPRFQAPQPAQLADVQYLDRILKPVTHGKASPGFALNDRERALLTQNRFVASERLGDVSYAGLYHRIYEHDQPVFITADSVLHAFHMSYDAMLAQLETEYLIGALNEVLTNMAGQLKASRAAHDGDALREAVRDADIYLAVARALLNGEDRVPLDPAGLPRVREIVDAIKAERSGTPLKLFGYEREEDFSQMKPRGHYSKTAELERYFRAMMWLGRTELRVAGDGVPTSELAGAVVLHELLVRARELPRWQQMDRLIEAYVGPPDAMTAPQLDRLLSTRQLGAPLSVGELQTLQVEIARNNLGAQQINSAIRLAHADSTTPTPLPNSFVFFPQRFTIDAWVLSQLVFDRARYQGASVDRQIPSGVDVAFSGLGNDDVAGMLAERIEQKDGVVERDGLPIQASLLATRAVIDARPKTAWDANLYEGWIGLLRGLSEPTVDERYPSVMRSEAWSQRRLQTQLASWAELRHDTILYVKQSYGMVSCEYPAGFVELQPEFWKRLEDATTHAASVLERTSFPKQTNWLKDAQLAHWKSFAKTAATLGSIANKELTSVPMSPSELQFLKEAVERTESAGCGGPVVQWDGWFIELYYLGSSDALEWDALVADVHTTGKGDILTVATGGVDLMVAIVERGTDTMAFAGPTAQYWELVVRDGVRMTDREWKGKLADGTAPPRPEWTSKWLSSGQSAVLGYQP